MVLGRLKNLAYLLNPHPVATDHGRGEGRGGEEEVCVCVGVGLAVVVVVVVVRTGVYMEDL